MIMSVMTANFGIWVYGNQMRAEYDQTLAVILGNIAAVYPQVPEEKIVQVLNVSKAQEDDENYGRGIVILAKYGVFPENSSFAILEKEFFGLSCSANLFLLLLSVLIAFCLFYDLSRRQKKITEIKDYMVALNHESYKLALENNADDELSGLRNEIYKLTVLLKERADKAVEQRHVLADSMADISHQLKTPLTSMTVLVNNLSENLDMDMLTRQRFLSEIMRQLTGMSWLIAAMLKLSRLDAGVVELEHKPFKLADIVKETIEKVELAAEWRNVSFSVHIPDAAQISGDRKWTAEALMNIVKNAVEHSPEGGMVEIAGEENEVYAQITVRDYGAGITKEEQEKLFRRFYRGGGMKEDSVGIGLALAKEIVEREGGRISVDSREGEGTVFVLRFVKSM